MEPEAFVRALYAALDKSANASTLWKGHSWMSDPWKEAWTVAMTSALARVAHEMFPEAYVAGKGIDPKAVYCDPHNRREYLSLDLTVYDNSGWSAPLLIAEHENNSWSPKLKYCAWKLLSVYAAHRILVGYYDSSGTYPGCLRSAAELKSAVNDVLNGHRSHGKQVLLVSGDWSAPWGGMFQAKQLA